MNRAGDGPPRGAIGGIFRNAGWLFGGKAVGAILSLAYLGLATRLLGPANFGQFVLVLGMAQAVTTIVAFQTWQIVVHYGTAHLLEGRHDKLRRLIQFATLLDLASAVLGMVIVAGAVLLLGHRFGWSPTLERDALLFTAALLFSLRSTPTGVLRLHDRYRAAALVETLTPTVRLAGASLLLLWEPSVRLFLVAWAAAEFVTAAAYWVSAARLGRLFPHAAEQTGRAAVEAENGGLWRYGLSLNAASTLEHATKQVIVLMVGWAAGPVAAGGYRLAHQLGQALAKVSSNLSRAAFPEFVRAGSSVGSGDLARLLLQLTKYAVWGTVIIILFLWFAGDALLAFVAGPGFSAAYPLLLVLGTAAAIELGGVMFEPALFAVGRSGLALRLRFAMSVLTISLVLVLLNRFGAIGAAVAVLIGAVATVVALGVAVLRAVRRQPEKRLK